MSILLFSLLSTGKIIFYVNKNYWNYLVVKQVTYKDKKDKTVLYIFLNNLNSSVHGGKVEFMFYFIIVYSYYIYIIMKNGDKYK